MYVYVSVHRFICVNYECMVCIYYVTLRLQNGRIHHHQKVFCKDY